MKFRGIVISSFVAVTLLTSAGRASAQDHQGSERDVRGTTIEEVLLSKCYVDQPYDASQIYTYETGYTATCGYIGYVNGHYQIPYVTKEKILLIITSEYGQVTQLEIERTYPNARKVEKRWEHQHCGSRVPVNPEMWPKIRAAVEKDVQYWLKGRASFQCTAQ
jgi:hypothetical protein